VKKPGDMRAHHIARRAGCRQSPTGAPQLAIASPYRKSAATIFLVFPAELVGTAREVTELGVFCPSWTAIDGPS
jgi:hypothetical protein